MTWSPRFVRELGSGRALRHLIEPVRSPVELKDYSYWFVTSDGPRRLPLEIDAKRSGSSSGAEVRTRDWTSSLGSWRVHLVGNVGGLVAQTWRGQIVRHRVGFQGWPHEAFEPVQVGMVWNVTMAGPGRYTLHVRDLLSALQSRYARSAVGWSLFATLGATTTTTEDYNPGVEGPSLGVSSTTGFEFETGGKGLIVVDPNEDDRFYHHYTTVTSTAFQNGGSGNEYGTTEVLKAAGTTVREVALIEDHPIDVVRKILASKGSGTNGDYDTLPQSWGIGLRDDLLDHPDMNLWKKPTSPASGSASWAFISEEAQSNPIGWLVDRLSRGGFFLTTRQGRLTCRAAVDPNVTNADALVRWLPRTRLTIDADLLDSKELASLQWEAWDSHTIEHRQVKITTDSGSSTPVTENVRSHPALEEFEAHLAGLVFDNETAHRAHVEHRLKPWHLRLPERLTCALSAPVYRGLAPGDVLPIFLPFHGGRVEARRRRAGYEGRRGMVLSVNPDWWGNGPTRLVLGVPPDQDVGN